MIKDRIIQLIEFKGIAKESFYKKIGMTSASFRGKAKDTPINSNAIENILSIIPDTDLYWLISGKGNKVRTSHPILEKADWILPNEIARFKSSQFSDEALARVGYRIFIICETYNLEMHELGTLVGDANIPQYIAGMLPVPEATLDLILSAYPDISEKWLYTSLGPLKKQKDDLILKDYISTQKQLIEYKENEINQLKEVISELKKEKESSVYPTKVAESREKLKK